MVQSLEERMQQHLDEELSEELDAKLKQLEAQQVRAGRLPALIAGGTKCEAGRPECLLVGRCRRGCLVRRAQALARVARACRVGKLRCAPGQGLFR